MSATKAIPAQGPGRNECITTRGLGRRRFLGAALAAGSLGTSGLVSGTDVAAATGDMASQGAGLHTLDELTRLTQRWTGSAPADWVRPRPGVDHNVVVVGGGQSGIGIGYTLRRKGIGKVEIIDQSGPTQAGIWRTTARMAQLRTVKTLKGPEQDNAPLGFQAWYELQHGPAAFDALERIPTRAWADYLAWFQEVTGTTVRYRTRLVDIEPDGDILRLHLETDGVTRVESTRKLVLATGLAGAGGPNVPGFIRSLPEHLWTHSDSAFRPDLLKGKVVGVLGAGSSAFDAAGTALELGAAEVHLYSRRSYISYPGGIASANRPPSDAGHPNVVELFHELPDLVRWRNFLLEDRQASSAPLDSIGRAVAHDNFHIHLDSPWSETSVNRSGQIVATVAGEPHVFDHVLAGTGFRVDLSAQPELARFHRSITLWRDRFEPPAGEENVAAGLHPYLGAGLEFRSSDESAQTFLRNIHCFNVAALVSFGAPLGSVRTMSLHSWLARSIAADLFRESVDAAAHERYVTRPEATPNSAPYERAVRRKRSSAA